MDEFRLDSPVRDDRLRKDFFRPYRDSIVFVVSFPSTQVLGYYRFVPGGTQKQPNTGSQLS